MNDIDEIKKIVELYFYGAYEANESKLRRAFHPDAHIAGIFKTQYVDWILSDYIALTASKSAALNDENYDKEILFTDIDGNVAMVKARVIASGIHFIDFLTLLKINGCWVIRNKCFTTVDI